MKLDLQYIKSAGCHGARGISIALGITFLGILIVSSTSGCRTKKTEQQQNAFFTSGSPAADQRASQRMAQQEQLGAGGATGEPSGKDEGKGTNSAPKKTTLYERLGGQQGISAIVDNFLPRAMDDPRVNWNRTGVSAGGFLHTGHSPAWNPTPQNVAQLKQHMVEFFALATGGPANYRGRDMKSVHGNMNISNPEFDAAVGDLKVSLDALKVPDNDQKELLAIVESTRPQIVTER